MALISRILMPEASQQLAGGKTKRVLRAWVPPPEQNRSTKTHPEGVAAITLEFALTTLIATRYR
jgi:hypothetical protein